MGQGDLDWPRGLELDGNGFNTLVKVRIIAYLCSPEGRFVISFGRKESGPGEFVNPCGIAVDENGLVYVCNSGNDL